MKEKTKKFLKGLCTAVEVVAGSFVALGATEIGKVGLNKYIKPYMQPKNKFQALAIYGGGLAIATALGGVAYNTIKEVTDSVSESIDKADMIKKYKEKADEFSKTLTENLGYLTTDQVNFYTEEFAKCKTYEEIDKLIFELTADITQNKADAAEWDFDGDIKDAE